LVDKSNGWFVLLSLIGTHGKQPDHTGWQAHRAVPYAIVNDPAVKNTSRGGEPRLVGLFTKMQKAVKACG